MGFLSSTDNVFYAVYTMTLYYMYHIYIEQCERSRNEMEKQANLRISKELLTTEGKHKMSRGIF